MSRRLIALCASSTLVAGIALSSWWRAPAPLAYEACLAALTGDPVSALTIADTWQAHGGGDGARHCRGLALIALGKPADGAILLEQLSQQSTATPMARATVLAQAVQARLMLAQADLARGDTTRDDLTQAAIATEDASQALQFSPDNTELFIMRANAEGIRGLYKAAIEDISAALKLETRRPDALVLRAMMWRKLNQLDLAQADVSRALTLDPNDADALLERGILRQRMGDRAGAQADWEHARGADPNSTTADLAEQNLSLLEAGPLRQ
jgi:tetratricopeptide (TPR) repeat protein